MTRLLYSLLSSSAPPVSNNPKLWQCNGEKEGIGRNRNIGEEEVEKKEQLHLSQRVVGLFRKGFCTSCIAAEVTDSGGGRIDDISRPREVLHLNHVTFDQFDGFLGLPLEFQPDVPRKPPSASATVFGVSTESMQMTYDARGNSVPTILLLMQSQLYSQGGLVAEGIFRVTPGNTQEETLRAQLNRGVIPERADVYSMAALIKAWFRELPIGLLDSLSTEQVMQCQSEHDCLALARALPETEGAILDWAINLMADVGQMEHVNKMNPRNIAMVFAPNMTKMNDALTALMYAVQVTHFLKTLIERTLWERVAFREVPNSSPRWERSHNDDTQMHQEPQDEVLVEITMDFATEDSSGSEISLLDHHKEEDYEGSESFQIHRRSISREAEVIKYILGEYKDNQSIRSNPPNDPSNVVKTNGQQHMSKVDVKVGRTQSLGRVNSIREWLGLDLNRSSSCRLNESVMNPRFL